MNRGGRLFVGGRRLSVVGVGADRRGEGSLESRVLIGRRAAKGHGGDEALQREQVREREREQRPPQFRRSAPRILHISHIIGPRAASPCGRVSRNATAPATPGSVLAPLRRMRRRFADVVGSGCRDAAAGGSTLDWRCAHRPLILPLIGEDLGRRRGRQVKCTVKETRSNPRRALILGRAQ